MKCSHCGITVQDTGRYYPIGDVWMRIHIPYNTADRHDVKNLCRGCQQDLKDEVLSVIEFYQKEKAAL